MALEKSDLTTISKYVRDSVQRLPPRAMKAVGIGRLLGSPEADTPPSSDASDRLATTQFVQTALGVYAPINSPVFTGDPKAPTPATGDNDTSIATTQFVQTTVAAGPGHEVGYDQITATVNVTGLAPTSPTPVIVGSSHTFDGSPVIVEFSAPLVDTPGAAAGNSIAFGFYDNAAPTTMMVFAALQTPAAAVLKAPVVWRFRYTPTAGTHGYRISAWVSNTTGTPAVEAGTGAPGTASPAYLRFTKV